MLLQSAPFKIIPCKVGFQRGFATLPLTLTRPCANLATRFNALEQLAHSAASHSADVLRRTALIWAQVDGGEGADGGAEGNVDR